MVKAEANSLIQAKEAAQRRLAESLSKTMSDIARATRASQDECQRQLGMMNMRVKAELDAVRAGEREKAQEQLDRLLDELAVSEEKAAKLIDQIKEMENQHKQVGSHHQTARNQAESPRTSCCIGLTWPLAHSVVTGSSNGSTPQRASCR